jgi:hypothetical protein
VCSKRGKLNGQSCGVHTKKSKDRKDKKKGKNRKNKRSEMNVVCVCVCDFVGAYYLDSAQWRLFFSFLAACSVSKQKQKKKNRRGGKIIIKTNTNKAMQLTKKKYI